MVPYFSVTFAKTKDSSTGTVTKDETDGDVFFGVGLSFSIDTGIRWGTWPVAIVNGDLSRIVTLYL